VTRLPPQRAWSALAWLFDWIATVMCIAVLMIVVLVTAIVLSHSTAGRSSAYSKLTVSSVDS
jgi:hypothetical protein